MARPGTILEVASAFLKLGAMSFGGPVAHLAYFRDEFVARRGWLAEDAYADLVALCQFLPGPASSQVVFALGMLRAGLGGAIAGSLCFMMPSVVIMLAFAYGVGAAVNLHGGWLHGLKLAAVAVVAQAVWSMGRRLCTTGLKVAVCVAAAAVVLAMPGALTQVAVIAAGALFGAFAFQRPAALPPAGAAAVSRGGKVAAGAALLAWAVLLAALPALARVTPDRHVALFDSFYRAGSLVFGGGHVILPLLREELVPRGWISDDAFLAGYGAAQALPGPLSTFAAYLGAVMDGGPNAWMQGLWCLLAIFLPAWLLIGGALPFWQRLREKRHAQTALQGANAAVVGVLLAALYTPVVTQSVTGPRDMAAALIGFAALQVWKAPPWCVVMTMAALGAWVL